MRLQLSRRVIAKGEPLAEAAVVFGEIESAIIPWNWRNSSSSGVAPRSGSLAKHTSTPTRANSSSSNT